MVTGEARVTRELKMWKKKKEPSFIEYSLVDEDGRSVEDDDILGVGGQEANSASSIGKHNFGLLSIAAILPWLWCGSQRFDAVALKFFRVLRPQATLEPQAKSDHREKEPPAPHNTSCYPINRSANRADTEAVTSYHRIYSEPSNVPTSKISSPFLAPTMSRYWPHTAYAEDQLNSREILYTHVITRGLQVGAIVGGGVGATSDVLRNFGILKPRIPPAPFVHILLRSTGVGGLIGLGLSAIMVPGRMNGKEDIEWRDRSWRLLENKGQVACDDWTYGGMALGAASIALGKSLGWRGAAGKVCAGSVVGMLGYMGWQYGVKRRTRETLKH